MAAEHKQLHVLTEGLGVLSGIYLMRIAKNTDYPKTLYTIGLATLLVDMFFLGTWKK